MLKTASQKSLRQEYEEYVLQRIEELKERLSRQELLAIADEAVRELEMGVHDQLVLTEVLMLEHVDRLIMRRLKLPPFRKWREKHLKLRRAQQRPTHWGLNPRTPVLSLAAMAADAGIALVLGARATANALLLAAHGMDVMLVDSDLNAVEAIDNRAVAESLSARIQTMVVASDGWFPEIETSLVVMESHSLVAGAAFVQTGLISKVKQLTVPGGSHCIIRDSSRVADETIAGIAAEHYAEWDVDDPEKWAASCLVAHKPKGPEKPRGRLSEPAP